MFYFFSERLPWLFGKKLSAVDQTFLSNLRALIGKRIGNIEFYRKAMLHPSAGQSDGKYASLTYERLEYLGDAVLSMVVAEYLYRKFPFEREGFLTEVRSRIVSRESLNEIGKKLGLEKILTVSLKNQVFSTHKSVYGNTLEALVGAVYLDKGFKGARQFILHQLLVPHVDIQDVVENNRNFKSMLLEWTQKNGLRLEYKIVEEIGARHQKEFVIELNVPDRITTTGRGTSKKRAEQAAAELACAQLGLN